MGQEKHRHPMQFLLYKKVPPVSAEIHGTFPFFLYYADVQGKIYILVHRRCHYFFI